MGLLAVKRQNKSAVRGKNKQVFIVDRRKKLTVRNFPIYNVSV